jgi:hypothetical protein
MGSARNCQVETPHRHLPTLSQLDDPMGREARRPIGGDAAVRALGADANADADAKAAALVARALAILGEEREIWRMRRPLPRSPGW